MSDTPPEEFTAGDAEDSEAPGQDSPEAQLFRHPPDRITAGCAGYMDRVQELRGFLSMFFQMVKGFQPLVRALQKTAPDELGEIAKRTAPMAYYYSAHRQFLNELVLARAVESFDLYVLTTLRAIFRVRPEILKSESPIDIATIVDLRSVEDILTYVAERRVHELSFKALSELDKFIQTRTGVPLFGTPQTYQLVLIASEVRNLIAHNDCVVNDHFRRRVGGALPAKNISEEGKLMISDCWMREVSYTLDAVVFDFDTQVAAKFSIPTLDSSGFLGSRPGGMPSIEAVRSLSEKN